MDRKLPQQFAVFLLAICYVHCQSDVVINPCCANENVIHHKKCLDGSNITALSCPFRYLITKAKEPNVVTDNSHNLLVNEAIIAPDRYCTSRFNSSQDVIFLVCFPDESKPDNYPFLVYAILELISLIFIVLTVLVYIQLPDLLDTQGICILHAISGLGVTFLVLSINQIASQRNQSVCVASAFIIYFACLYAFFWLNALSFHIWKTIVKPKLFNFSKYWLKIYHIFAVGGPILLVFLVTWAHNLPRTSSHPGFGETKCWFRTNRSEILYFYIPISILIFFNIIYYCWTIRILWKDLDKCDDKKGKVLKFRLKLCLKLFFIMGLQWVFEVLSGIFQDVHVSLKILWTLTDCFNALQGVLIFFILVIYRKKVIRDLANRSFCGIRLPNKWKTVTDDECEDIEEEFGLSESNVRKV